VETDLKGFEQYSPTDKHSILAKSVLVFLRGLTANWKQPLAYYFDNGSCKVETVKSLILEVLSKVQDIGIHDIGAGIGTYAARSRSLKSGKTITLDHI